MYNLEDINIINTKNIYYNLSVSRLIEEIIRRNEGILVDNGAININTGKYTGRSPKDKFIVDEPEVHNEIWWENNEAISIENFEKLYNRVTAYLQNRDLFIFDGFVGADPSYRLPIRLINEYAYQNLFGHQLFIRPTDEELKTHKAEFTIITVPGFNTIPGLDGVNSEAFIVISFTKKIIIIGSTQYAGEIKKSVFSVMNYLMVKHGIMPMHCSANVGKDKDTALFFGLSGTGKTTLSADSERFLIGDDEHGWSDNGIFNFEGGCYAKCINLSKEKEPQIWNAIKFGTILENVVYDDNTRKLDYSSKAITENTRAAYPIDYIPGAVLSGIGGHPKTIVFLTADAFGVLPPISRLSKEQAMYYFISGYTSKLAGTERGITIPEATFSACFAAPFLPLHPMVYAKLLGEKIDKYNSKVYLINTGWSGGPYGIGKRIDLAYTRSMVSAALRGDLNNVKYIKDPVFNLSIPKSCPNVPYEILNPINTWKDKEAYNLQAKNLARKFFENINSYNIIPEEIKNAGPKA
ncbi:phosphoenolpyruvate carboxykinase (ATP) [Aceticella autotrophica]|uniref:Phosphoenolpyruvate carboxykinase (ATP) n=1 Tax=Aceticella autotrophica TaxID=2755338 RepID=A0A975GAK5_9THEO|nr:phosphoenolpyruvate carboxykinase (ATP) [Aceticella autotrophica]QSZ27488.1 phosphoenolpyruvate carboxykinase (ATP) [Aceticella autotrophica]